MMNVRHCLTGGCCRSVARNRQSVKRVILSSSVAAMEKKKAGPINGKLYTEVRLDRRHQ